MVQRSLVELLSELIAIPSVNPDATADKSNSGELRVAEYVAAYLEARGFSITWQDRETGRPNIIGSFGPESANCTVAFEAHLDTVGVEGMKRPPFKAVEEDGRLYGRGACDDKGPMAAALFALKPGVLQALAARGVRVVFVGVMGEEKGNIGAERLVELGFKADKVVVLEPTELTIVHAHKGALWFEVELRGRAGHGSDPARGVSAITAMADVLAFLKESADLAASHLANPILGKPTLNIGSIHGGSSVNIVPDRCVIEVDRRLLPEENGEALIEQIRSKLDQMQTGGSITGYDIRMIKMGVPFQTAAESRLVGLLSEACRDNGVVSSTKGAAWYSDAGALSKVCQEIVVFGPGSIKQAHTVDEFIDLRELEQGSKIIELFLGKI